MRVLSTVLLGVLLTGIPACGGDDEEDKGGGSPCERGCTLIMAAMCPNSPPSQASCVSQCNSFSTGPCKAEYAAFQACADGEPVTCASGTGIPTFAACSSEQSAFTTCLASM